MSQRAILLAARDTIKGATFPGLANPLGQLQCEVQFDGQPPPECGMYFVAVHPGEWRNQNGPAGTCLDELFGFDVTVTLRATVQPLDRYGVNLLAGNTGQCLDQITEQLRALLHLNYGLMTAAIGYGGTGFVEPPYFESADPPQPRGPEWFSTFSETEQRINPPVGLSQTLHFVGGNRIQDIASET